jgi:hypothetical protein
LLKPNGWGWIAPWNGVPQKGDLSTERIAQILRIQAEALGDIGFTGFDLTEELSVRYGVHGETGNRALFIRGLPAPPATKPCGRLI